jgi:hypothetical protein
MKAKKVKKISGKSIREKNIATFAKKTANRAVKRAMSKNISITVARGGKIYRLHPDGRKEIVNQLPQRVRVKQSVIKIG